MVAPLFILPHIVHLQGIDNLQSGFKCKQIMVAPISILSHSLKFPRELMLNQVIKLEDNSKLVQDQAVKHEKRKELRYQYDVLVRNMETLTVE